MIRIIIIDDHPIVLEGLSKLLAGKEGMEVVGSYTHGEEGLAAIAAMRPDVLLLDLNLPDLNGRSLCEIIRRKYRELRIIILSMHNEQLVIRSMLQQGVHGYVIKNAIGGEIVEAIYTVVEGRTYLCSKTQEVLENKDTDHLTDIPRLTRREKEVLSLIGNGLTTAQIAAQLFISVHTVESHRKNLMDKFEVNNMPSVIRLATEYNLL